MVKNSHVKVEIERERVELEREKADNRCMEMAN